MEHLFNSRKISHLTGLQIGWTSPLEDGVSVPQDRDTDHVARCFVVDTDKEKLSGCSVVVVGFVTRRLLMNTSACF